MDALGNHAEIWRGVEDVQRDKVADGIGGQHRGKALKRFDRWLSILAKLGEIEDDIKGLTHDGAHGGEDEVDELVRVDLQRHVAPRNKHKGGPLDLQ